MELDVLLRFAQRVRAMMLRTHTDVVKEQLRMWAEEFEERAANINRHESEIRPQSL
jgi:hypothetical protein